MNQAINNGQARVSALALVSAVAILAACGGGGSDAPPVAAPPPAPAPASVAPVVTTDVGAASVAVGGDVTFAVTSTGTTLAYQWQISADGTAWSDIAAATADTLTLKAVAFSDGGKQVRVVISNSVGSVTSSPALLTVTAVAGAPVVGTQPLAVSLVAPAVATFSVVATGTPTPAYQWQRSNDAGVTFTNVGTGASYSTAATAISDNGALFRVTVSNASGSVTSDSVLLAVATTNVAPAVTAQPQAVGVTAPGAATFNVTATGTPPPAFQWQLSRDAGASYAIVAGATAASFTTPATAAADNGALYRVTASNAAGSVTSGAARLTVAVNAAASVLAGRAWAAGQLLETDDNPVREAFSSIDDNGRMMVVYKKSNGTRDVLYATRGTPGAAGVAPSFSAPIVIDTAAGVTVQGTPSYSGFTSFGMASAPNGNSVAVWVSKAPCTAATYSISGTCNFLYSARFTAATNVWEAPVLIADTPSDVGTLRIGNGGDVALQFVGWARQGTSQYARWPAVAWRGAAQAAYQQRLITDAPLGATDLGIDKDGNMVLAAEAKQNATTDLVVYRGSVAAGFGAQQVLDTRSAPVVFKSMAVGVNGQVIVLWHQSNGVTDTYYGATTATPAGAFVVTDLNLAFHYGPTMFTVAPDNGDLIVYSLDQGVSLRWSANAWSGKQALPVGVNFTGDYAFARNGNFLNVSYTNGDGVWMSYDATRNTLIQSRNNTSPGAGYVLGLNTVNKYIGFGTPVLSISGVGGVTFLNGYDVLPSAAAPAGDARAIKNLWGAYLK